MGCDIHLKIQFRENGKWEYGDAVIDQEPKDDWTKKFCSNREGQWTVAGELGNRNYLRFAILANVRNGHGFAGVFTHEPLEPIAEPRGLPKDLETPPYERPQYMDEFYKEHPEHDDEEEEFWFGDHSFSWVTLREMMDYDYDHELQEGGIVDIGTYKAWKESGNPQPEGWSGGVWGGKTVVSPEDDITEKTTHVQARWAVPLKEALGDRWFWCIEALLKEAKQRGISPDDVRLVFGFDS